MKPLSWLVKQLAVVGGEITDPDRASKIAKAGADIIVVGNLIQNPRFENHFVRLTGR